MEFYVLKIKTNSCKRKIKQYIMEKKDDKESDIKDINSRTQIRMPISQDPLLR